MAGLIGSYGYAVLFLLVGLESLGIPLPGETALVTAAAFAALGHLSISAVIATAVAAAIIGDNAHAFFEQHGPKTVFIGRFIALLRTWAAVLAGAAHMPYGTLMLFNELGGGGWSVIVGMLGYVFGRNLPQLERYMGQASLAGVVPVALVVGLG